MKAGPLALALACCACLACTRIWPFNRLGARPSETTAAVASASNDAGIKATVSSVKERSKLLTLTLTLANGSTQGIEFRNPPSLRVAGFKLAADGREGIGADGGKLDRRTPAALLKELAPNAKTEVELRYAFEPPLAHESYPWTLTVSNLWAGGQQLGDITLTYAPPAGAK